MSGVIALDDFRAEKRFREQDVQPLERPVFRAGDVWGRNYKEIESVVYGILKARETLKYYTFYSDELDDMLLEILDAAYNIEKTGPKRLTNMVLPVKEYILDNITENNVKHMKTVLVIMDLIEKSPTYR